MVYRYSAINCSYFCQKKYELEYVWGIRSDTPSIDLDFGTAIHFAIADHWQGKDAIESFKTFWQDQTALEYPKARFSKDQLCEIGTILLDKWLKRHAQHYEPIHVEKRVKYKIGGFDFEGTPDFIGKYRGRVVVADWKTSAIAYDKRKPVVEEQLWIYAEACYQNYGFYPDDVMYGVFVKDGASVQNPLIYPFSSKKLKEALDNVTLTVRDLDGKQQFPMNRNNCLKCSHFSHCYKEFVNE